MKPLPVLMLSLALASLPATAANLLLDFGNPTALAGGESNTNTSPGPVASGTYLTLSPGHALGSVPAGQTSWNTITASTSRTDLVFGDGSAAMGITLTLGQEATGGNGTISYTTAITNTALVGSGGGNTSNQSLLHGTGAEYGASIYGNNRTTSSAVGRDGFFGGGAATTTGAAIGLRLDGLAPGDYLVYVMARNTNSNANGTGDIPGSMNIYAGTGAESAAFAFSSLTPYGQGNNAFTNAAYAGQFAQFSDGENYVGFSVTLGEDESLFLAVDGANGTVERRGFLNMVQIVAVPEPSLAMLGSLGLLALLRRRR